MRIIWSDRAIDRLAAIRSYIAEDAPLTANRVDRKYHPIDPQTTRLSSFR